MKLLFVIEYININYCQMTLIIAKCIKQTSKIASSKGKMDNNSMYSFIEINKN